MEFGSGVGGGPLWITDPCHQSEVYFQRKEFALNLMLYF